MDTIAGANEIKPDERNDARNAGGVEAGEPKADASTADTSRADTSRPATPKANEPPNSIAKFQGFVGIIAITIGNVAAMVTHVEEIRKFVSRMMGTEWVYRFHDYIVVGASALLLFGYASLTYWLYWNFIVGRRALVRAVFFVSAIIAVGSTVLGTYWFLFRVVNVEPLIRVELVKDVQIILSQQVSGGEDDGGFRFSQSGVSTEAQVWTTAQCLTSLLQQDASVIKAAGPALRRAFDYIERSRLKQEGAGWSYVKSMNFGVTEIDAWVALAYLYSLRADNAAIIWKPDELRTVVRRRMRRSTRSLCVSMTTAAGPSSNAPQIPGISALTRRSWRCGPCRRQNKTVRSLPGTRPSMARPSNWAQNGRSDRSPPLPASPVGGRIRRTRIRSVNIPVSPLKPCSYCRRPRFRTPLSAPIRDSRRRSMPLSALRSTATTTGVR
jgi:hypothetical protein